MFFGWRVVGCTFLIAVWGWGLGFYGLSVYLVALQRQNAWSATTVSLSMAAYYLIGAALMTVLSDTMRRLGPRRSLSCAIDLERRSGQMTAEGENPDAQSIGSRNLLAPSWALCLPPSSRGPV